MSDWHPISTVPKDGTYVLLFQPAGQYEDAESRVVVAAWDGEDWHLSASGAYAEDWAFDDFELVTHWMPLPQPPSQRERAA